MPPGKKPQSNAMLYTLITFVGLFIITTTVAVIYYVKFEEQRDIATTKQSQIDKLATSRELRKGLGKIIGTIPRGKSGLGTMVDHIDTMISLIIGGIR